MLKLCLFSLTILLFVACAQAPQRHPSSVERLDEKMTETEKHLENLQKLKNSHRVEIYVEFKDSGRAGKSYDILAEVFSNELEAVKKAQIFIAGSRAWDLELKKQDNRVYIDQRIPFMLPIGTTKLRFDLGEEGFREVDLVCTRPGKCL